MTATPHAERTGDRAHPPSVGTTPGAVSSGGFSPMRQGGEFAAALATAKTIQEVDGFALAFRWMQQDPTPEHRALVATRRAEIQKGRI